MRSGGFVAVIAFIVFLSFLTPLYDYFFDPESLYICHYLSDALLTFTYSILCFLLINQFRRELRLLGFILVLLAGYDVCEELFRIALDAIGYTTDLNESISSLEALYTLLAACALCWYADRENRREDRRTEERIL